jgi:hypothetical protein
VKYIIILLTAFNLNNCSIYSQKKHGKLIIDDRLTNYFFENPPILAQEGSYKVYRDSILIDSNYYDTSWNVVINADINEISGKHYSFDSCNSFFLNDTLVVEFKAISKFLKNKIRIKIIKEKFYASFISGYDKKEFEAIPLSLKFKKKIEKKGQEIFGELTIEFRDPETNYLYNFKGPFICMVE